MSNKPPNQCSLTLWQHDLDLILAAYNELDYVRKTETVNITSEIKAFEQFAQELIRAINDDPEIGPVDALNLALDTDGNSLEVTMDVRIIMQFIDACLRLEDQFTAKIWSKPFHDLVTERALGDLKL